MGLPRRAQALIATCAVGGPASIFALWSAAGRHHVGHPVLSAALTVLVFASLARPLLVFHEAESLGIHLDEACLVMMLLSLPTGSLLLGCIVAVVAVEIYRRPPLAKAVFNAGQRLASIAAAVAVAGAIHSRGVTLTPLDLVAATAGAATFFAVNTVLVGWVIAAVGQAPLRAALFEAWRIRLLLLCGNVAVGLVAALAVDSHPWSMAVTVLPLLILRQVLVGHFRARHDRYRLRGLFEATSAVHQRLEAPLVRSTLEAMTSNLLRGSATLRNAPPLVRELGAALPGMGDEWIVVSGRNRNEPFDDLDRDLLDALGAVGASALSNARAFDDRTRERQRLLAITSSLGEGVCAIDGEARITFANPVAAALLGEHASSTVVGATAPMWLAEPALACMRSAATVRSDEATFCRSDGSLVPVSYTCSPLVEHGEAVGAVVAFSDISERKRFEERLTHQAFHDQLTGLPNRRLFLDRLSHALRRSVRHPAEHAVLFLDVDRFKVTNDSLGHQAGDQLLSAIAERISALLRPADTLARFGGDEFAILLEDVTGTGEATALAERILAGLRRSIQLGGGHEVVTSVSIGVALTGGRDSADDIVHDADVAMYEAKHRGAGRHVVFDGLAMGTRSAERIRLESELRRSLEEGGVVVHYQPLVDTRSGRWLGAEALVRWQHPSEGLLSPDRFIGVAEETGLILPLGRLVFEAACRQARAWADVGGGEPFTVSVNLSARQFRDPGLVDDVASVLAITGAEPSLVCLEITETVAVDDIDATVTTLHRLKALGVRLAIDDFGTGYSSLGYLKRFPVDVVKVDRTFIRELPHNAVDGAIVAAVVGLATAVGMVTVAEGVEHEAQRATLESLGCPLAQGFMFARPMAADRLTAGLQARRLGSSFA